jgi:murein DD-endopeptidase MepM/ murein hydrolase activator NlpD
MVEIDHGMGMRTRYAHLRRALVRPGDRVARRTTIGIMGDTGRSTGPHLHYEVRLDGRPLDPMGFLEAGRRLGRALQG